MKAIVVHALLLSGKTALSVILCCLSPSSLWCPLSFLGFLGGPTLFWVVRCLPIILLGDRVFHILVARDRLCELSLARYEMMAIVAVDTLQYLRVLILVSWWQAVTSIVIGLSLQIADCCGVGALVGLKSPWSLFFPVRNRWTKSQRFHACNWHS